MVCLGFEPGAAGWKARTNPLSYGGTPVFEIIYQSLATLGLLSLHPPSFINIANNLLNKHSIFLLPSY